MHSKDTPDSRFHGQVASAEAACVCAALQVSERLVASGVWDRRGEKGFGVARHAQYQGPFSASRA